MKAVFYDRRNAPDRLTYGEVEKPVPKDDQVLVQVCATSVNAADYRSLKMRIIPRGRIFGADVAGVVEAAGRNVRNIKPGDEVIGDLSNHGFGGFAEYAVGPERAFVVKPRSLPFESAAALPLAALTALQALRDAGKIQPGQNILILGSGGGVGTFAVQIAKYFGAHVTAVCSARNLEQTRRLGADQVVDYAQADVTRNSGAYDLILAVNGDYSLSSCKACLKPGGRYVMVGGALSQIFKALLLGRLMSFGSKTMTSLMAKPNPEDLAFLAGLADEGCIQPVIETIYPLERTAEAMRHAASGHARGKVVVRVLERSGLE